jgi:hypothetical protein
MNIRQICLSIAAVLTSMVATGSYAAEASPTPAATPASGTHETRSAERKKVRAANKEANKKGEIPKTTEASATPSASAASGTHETRSAERKKVRAANAEANKKGEIPKTTEAGEIKK